MSDEQIIQDFYQSHGYNKDGKRAAPKPPSNEELNAALYILVTEFTQGEESTDEIKLIAKTIECARTRLQNKTKLLVKVKDLLDQEDACGRFCGQDGILCYKCEAIKVIEESEK